VAERADVVVIGGGVMGLATARALATTGREPVLLERFTVGHPYGSSHGSARIFRLAYTDPAFVRMGREARLLWAELEEERGEQLLAPTPAVSFGTTLDALEQAMRAGGATLHVASATAVRERYPALRLAGVERALLEPDAAVIAADRALAALRASAEAHGAEIRERAPVTALRQGQDGVVVSVEGHSIEAGSVVVAAGSWGRVLLAGADIDLPTWSTVETVGYFDGPAEVPILLDWDDPVTTYMLPTSDGALKAAEHIGGPTATPDDPTPPDEAALGRVGRWLQTQVAGARAQPTAAETCRYTMTDDERFILDRHDRIVVASACSGHGFKFAPLIGARAASLAVSG